MKISQEGIDAYRKIYKEEFSEEVSEGDARIQLGRLVELYHRILVHQHERESHQPNP